MFPFNWTLLSMGKQQYHVCIPSNRPKLLIFNVSIVNDDDFITLSSSLMFLEKSAPSDFGR